MSSSPPQDPQDAMEDDHEMQVDGERHEDEGEDAQAPASDDSSEEPEEDAEEERRIRDGFIVDEDEEEEEEDNSEEERKRRRKRHKRSHRRVEEEDDEGLEEDDLELLEENTGGTFARKTKLTRLRRGRGSESPPRASSSKRKAVVTSSEDDLDADEDLPQVQDIQRIWDDERAAAGRDDDEDFDDMDNFIDYDEDEEGAGMDEDEREERRKERRRLEKERRKALGSRPELTGIDANAWDEIHEVFGDGHDYDWALVDDEEEYREEQVKPDMNFQDVFEPSEIRERLLTEDDDLIRARDVPERMQLATSTLSQLTSLSVHKPFAEEDIDDAAAWILPRLSSQKERDFFRQDGPYHSYLETLVDAIQFTLRQLLILEFEVPYVWTYKRDYLTVHHADSQVDLLTLDELWRVYTLGQKYRALLERREALETLYARLGVSDEHYENEIRRHIDSVEFVADATEWLGLKYKEEKSQKKKFELHFHDDEEEAETEKKRKLPSRSSGYEVAKKSVISKLAEGFGIKSDEIVMNFVSSETAHFVEDAELAPEAFAEQFADPDPAKALPAVELLRRARMIIATELGKDPLLRKEMRKVFKEHARVSVLPTERGINKIDEHHPYFAFKYLHQKPVLELLDTSQFLYMLAAESEHLVTLSIYLPDQAKANFFRRLEEAFTSDGYSDVARAWNAERLRVINETVEQHLIPIGVKWTREWLRDEVEDLMASRCGDALRSRIDVASFTRPDMPQDSDELPWVLAMSWGKGDPQKDAITCVGFDDGGRLREHLKIDNLTDEDPKAEFLDLVTKRPWNVIVIGGFSMATTRLARTVKDLFLQGDGQPAERFQHIIVTYAQDETARIFQHSKRAAEEYPSWPPIARYCAGLARYVQSPLNEYAALGPDIASISFEEDHQQLIPRDKLLSALERALVDVTNKVGVDINRAVNDGYYQHLLPFICGLGPRKAQVVIKKIASLGGTLVSRDQFIRAGIMTTKIFLNAAGFLRIVQDHMEKPSKSRHDDDLVPDPLDGTRIHPEDYDLARKMATDALELDEEDVHGEHPSHVISLIMEDADNVKKLDELNLDEFAVSLAESSGERKRTTLSVIRANLIRPFEELRKPMPPPTPWEVLTMLSGETPRTLRVGLIVAALITFARGQTVTLRLDSGVEGAISPGYLADHDVKRVEDVVKKGQTIPGVIVNVKLDLPADKFFVELSTRPTDVQAGDSQFRRVKHDEYWNRSQYERDKEIQARKKRSEVDKTRRIIKHPNFHNFSSGQAEAYLDKQQRGDVVIRPSSKGVDHLAITWKVDDKLYQHIDVVEPDADPTGQSVGSRLIIDNKYEFSDLDELIVNHIQAMARRVEELMNFEKFKPGSEDELHLHLKNFVAANPSKSAYGFTLNRKRPGHFSLCFLANKNSTIQTWPVRVAPEAYYLFDTPATGVPELCNAFKVRHIHESQNAAGGAGGKTAYGGRTPARTPAAALSSMTPGRMSTRQPARTPNPYNAASARTPNPYNAPPPIAAARTPNPYPVASAPSGTTPQYPPPPGFGMPPPQVPFGYPPPPAAAWGAPPPAPAPFGQAPPDPHGMNPQRAAMIQGSNSAWGGQNGSGGW